jgi:hypothetical protein
LVTATASATSCFGLASRVPSENTALLRSPWRVNTPGIFSRERTESRSSFEDLSVGHGCFLSLRVGASRLRLDATAGGPG